MKAFLVKYELGGFVYHTEVITETSAGAMYWVMNAFPDATGIYVISSTDLHNPA